MKKLYESTIIKHLAQFAPGTYIDGHYYQPRDCLGCFVYWKLCEYFQPRNVLEIGFLEGMSFALFFEATDANTQYSCVDITFDRQHLFDKLYQQHPKYSNIEFIEVDSRNLEINQNYDLVHVDGDHSYDLCRNDVEKVLPWLTPNSILILDDVTQHNPGVKKVLDEYLLGQHQFVPFLATDKEWFFHHRSHDASDFLDNFLPNNTQDLMTFFNFDYQGHTVLRGHLPNFFNFNKGIFVDQLTKYKL